MMTRDKPAGTGLFPIATLFLENGGRIGVSPLPGRFGGLLSDLQAVCDWVPATVLSLTEQAEMDEFGSGGMGTLLARHGIDWRHLPIRDWNGLSGENAALWLDLSQHLHGALDRGEGVLVHCRGGHGRSGMIAMRLLIERGEDTDTALKRLRYVRPGAVEASAQMAWAMAAKRP